MTDLPCEPSPLGQTAPRVSARLTEAQTRIYVTASRPGCGHGRPGRVVLCDCGGGERVSAGHYDTQTHTDMCIRVKDGACLFGGSNRQKNESGMQAVYAKACLCTDGRRILKIYTNYAKQTMNM